MRLSVLTTSLALLLASLLAPLISAGGITCKQEICEPRAISPEADHLDNLVRNPPVKSDLLFQISPGQRTLQIRNQRTSLANGSAHQIERADFQLKDDDVYHGRGDIICTRRHWNAITTVPMCAGLDGVPKERGVSGWEVKQLLKSLRAKGCRGCGKVPWGYPRNKSTNGGALVVALSYEYVDPKWDGHIEPTVLDSKPTVPGPVRRKATTFKS